jgi:hypothetical protein
MEQLFGLSLTFLLAHPSETWAPGVMKCEASLDGTMIGTVYLDLCRCVSRSKHYLLLLRCRIAQSLVCEHKCKFVHTA